MAKRPDIAFVYVLGSVRGADRRSYVGWSIDVNARLARHNGGTGAKSTRGRLWVLLHVEGFKSKRKAMSREWHLKRDRKLRKALLAQL